MTPEEEIAELKAAIDEYYKPIENLYNAACQRAESIVRDEAFDYAADMLRRHADSYTARGIPGYYNVYMKAAEIVAGLKNRNTIREGDNG